MTTHAHTVSRTCDVAVVGGSAAGLAAALQLGRQQRSVIVLDAGDPRNAPASHLHGYLGLDGRPPAELLAIAREEVRGYGVEVLAATVVDVVGDAADGFRVVLDSGHDVAARQVIAATGIVDELPDVEGVAEHWGGDVVHCPFCHGFEVRDRRLVQVLTHPMGLHATTLFAHLTDDLAIVLHDGVGDDDPGLDVLRASGVTVVATPVRRLVSGADGHVTAVELADGSSLPADAVVVGGRFRPRDGAFASLALDTEAHASGLGDVVTTDAFGATSVPGVWAAGNLADPSLQLLPAAAHGSRVGAMVAFRLAHDDLEAASRTSQTEQEWDRRYDGGPQWSGHPNPALVAEMDDHPPGRALDVGAGEGGDALWLAARGWEVTASDVSSRALAGIAEVAADRGSTITGLRVDAGDPDPFPREGFDLVTAHYLPLRRSPDLRGVGSLLDAVAPGGTLLFVAHDLAAQDDDHDHRPLYDADAYVRPRDVAAVLAERGWDVEVHETRPRTRGDGTPHVDDVVLRARRTD